LSAKGSHAASAGLNGDPAPPCAPFLAWKPFALNAASADYLDALRGLRQNEGLHRIPMAFISRIFSRASRVPLPTLEELLTAKGLPAETTGLEEFIPEFEHQDAEGRQAWVDALAELKARELPLPMPWLDAQYELMPQIVPAWLAERENLYYRPCIEGLSERVLVAGKVMPTQWMKLWGVTEKEVTERALDHLREKSRGVAFQRLPSGVYQGVFGDGLDAARILTPEFWADLFPGQNTFVAVPAENILLVAPQVLLPKLVDAINRHLASAENRRIMATILQRVDGTILPATLQDPHPIAQPQREMRQGDLLFAYRVQDQDLDPAQGAPAEMGLLRTQQGRAISYAIWAEGRPVLLPDSDVVGFVNAQGKPLGFYFRQTLPRISELRGTVVDIWGPRRMRYEGFPTAEQLERLECLVTGEQMAGILKPGPAAPKPAAGPSSTVPPLSGSPSPVPAHLRGQSLGVQDSE
jgi:hypothetical protein